MPTDPKEELDELGDFLSDHYHKFAIMGIFGTVTVFLTDNWPNGIEGISARIGVVASLALFLLAAVWIVIKTFLHLRDSGNQIPTVAEIGYGVICLSTAILVIAVSSVFYQFDDATQIVSEGAVSFMVIIFYLRTYLRGFDDELEDPKGNPFVPVVGLGIGFYLVLDVFYNELRQLTASVLGLDWTLFAPLAVAFVGAHYLVSEGLLGILNVMRMGKEAGRLRDLRSVWRVRTSLAVSLMAVAVATIYAKRTAEIAVDPNLGFYRIAGQPAIDFMLAHWFGLAILFFPLLLWNPEEDGRRRIRALIGQVLAVFAISISIVDLVWLIPQGTHVITF